MSFECHLCRRLSGCKIVLDGVGLSTSFFQAWLGEGREIDIIMLQGLGSGTIHRKLTRRYTWTFSYNIGEIRFFLILAESEQTILSLAFFCYSLVDLIARMPP